MTLLAEVKMISQAAITVC